MMNAPLAKLVAPARREVLARRFRACIVCCAGFVPVGLADRLRRQVFLVEVLKKLDAVAGRMPKS
jgi:hypothetical protein